MSGQCQVITVLKKGAGIVIIMAREEINMGRIRIALIGYGNVGKAFAEMLLRREEEKVNIFEQLELSMIGNIVLYVEEY